MYEGRKLSKLAKVEESPRWGNRLWIELHSSLGDRIDKTFDILGEAYVLFAQAALAFDSAVYQGAYLLCRATLETGFYSILTRRWDKDRVISETPKTLDGEARTVYFAELAEAIRKTGMLSGSQERAVRRIQEHGNFVAHLANRQERQSRIFAKKAVRLVQDMSAKGSPKSEIAAAFKELGRESMFWMDSAKVLQDLRDTTSILETLIDTAWKNQR